MARRKAAAASQKSLMSVGFYPMLPKMATAVRRYTSVPGKYWQNCSRHDKEKRYKCIVVEFLAMHDFGDGKKGAVFKVMEMGNSP